MRLVKIGAAVLNQTPLAWEGNKANILAVVDAARAEGVTILCLPEMCITGYGCEDMFHAPGLQDMTIEVLTELLPYLKGMIVSLGLPVYHQNGVFNAACLVVDGELVGLVSKRYLAGEGLHYEPRWFRAWPEGVGGEITLAGRRLPMGDILFDCGGIRIGFEICEDAWAASRPGADLARRGVDIILNPSASHFAFGKFEVRKRFVVDGSRAFCLSYAYANQVGNEAGRALYDGGAIIASGGRLLAAGPRFVYTGHALTSAVVDVDLTRMKRAKALTFDPVNDADRDDCITVPFTFPDLLPEAEDLVLPSWETSLDLKEEEFVRAEALGLFDYLRKSRSRGFAVSLSGGADSTAVALLVALMVRMGIAELGREGFLEKLAYIPGLAEAETPEAIIGRLLVCVYQGTRNSSDTTRDAARTVAEALGAEFISWDVDELVAGYRGLVEKALDRDLSWEQDDIALQNIQARVRAPGIWMIANIRKLLLLATSNRSEAAVGYATMDGDTCGGLSPIGGIDKDFLRRWLRWMETKGPEGIGPIPALSVVNVQQPTAELRPPEEGQTDEGDLMPYDLLDAVERAAIRDKRSPVEVFREMEARFPRYGTEQLALWVERFFLLWARNQWKRERYAPSFHLDDENLDPKTWCRFPILSGGFHRELEALKAMVGACPPGEN